jgi:hypothetical protein
MAKPLPVDFRQRAQTAVNGGMSRGQAAEVEPLAANDRAS